MSYPFQKIEKKWQKFWEKNKFYQARDFDKKPKKYILIEFPYPSGDGLHVGHVRSYSALDALSRKKRMEGYNVLYPIGWDAFGLPTENYAIKKGIHPSVITKRNIKVFKKQLKSLGLSFDWSREINTTDPGYYKWTQWIFLQFFKHGLAYQAEMPINWCPKCKIGLANEEVVDGRCERCGAETEKRNIKQWLLKITKYANRLLEDLNKVDYLEKIKTQQINWIGRSEGVTIKFPILRTSDVQKLTANMGTSDVPNIEVFTTRADTAFGVTALVIAPEHPLIKNLEFRIKNLEEVKKYIKNALKKSEIERTTQEKEKTGVEMKGVKAINPVNNEKIPIWIGDYVVATYGGGAVMVVPAHDKRDFEFAKKYNLAIKQVIIPISGHPMSQKLNKNNIRTSDVQKLKNAFTEEGILTDSGQFSGLTSAKARDEITKWLEKNKFGKRTIQYKLRDWIFSRQHYWGEPIPLIFCENCKKHAESILRTSDVPNIDDNIRTSEVQEFNQGELLNPGWIAVPEKDLPVKLPFVKKYKPTKTGESPLAAITEWVSIKCPKCKRPAKRETDTMPNWAGSSWYFLRYIDTKNKRCFADFKKLKYWLPVDLYNGGMEHTTLHLLYSRFWHKFLYDLKLVPTPEPYASRRSHGMVLAEDARKMSKSFGNVINPDEIVKKFGADTLRMYEMFMGPFDQAINWNSQGVVGLFRFLNRVYKLKFKIQSPKFKTNSKFFAKGESASGGKIQNSKIEKLLHQSIKKISEDLEEMKFNTAVSQLMILVSEFEKHEALAAEIYEVFLKLLAPFAPHLAEELWVQLKTSARGGSALGGKNLKLKTIGSIHQEKWPQYDPKLIKEKNFELVIQINGKVRDKVLVSQGIGEKETQAIALSQKKTKKWLEGKKTVKTIFIPGKLINFVIK